MNDGNRLPLGAIWRESLAFARAEIALLAPLALLGFGLPIVILELIQPEKLVQDNKIVAGAWLFWLIPHGILSMLGTLSISALALNRGMSVRESLLLALSRLLPGIGIALIGFGVLVTLIVVVFAIAGVDIGPNEQLGPLSMAAFVGLLAVMVMVMVRATPIWAALADRTGSVTAIRRTFVLTRGGYAKLLLLRVISWAAQIAAAFFVLTPIAVTFGLLGKLLGAEPILTLVGLILNSAAIAALIAVWTVYVARLYLRLVGSSSGI